jgi:hypothetical protein
MQKRHVGRILQSKLSDVLQEIELGVKLYVRVGYVKATEKSLIMSGPTGQAVWLGSQLGWLVAIKIV